MTIDLIGLLLILAFLFGILGAIVLLPTDNQAQERGRMIRAMIKMRKRRGYRPCGRRR